MGCYLFSRVDFREKALPDRGLSLLALGPFVGRIRPLEVWIWETAGVKVAFWGRPGPAQGGTMQGANGLFVHVFLFECANCEAPVATARASGARNLEQMDARSFAIACELCGWSGKSIGTAAKRHWVDFWDSGGSAERNSQTAGTGKAV